MIGHKALTQIDVQTLFAMHKLRFTRQRMAIYLALATSDNHPTADELHQQVSHRDRSISLATVYNTLETLCNCNLSQKLATDSSSARYDATTHNHLHLRDQRSGQVKDVPDELGKQLLDQLPHHVLRDIESRLGYKISEVKIELVGEKS